MAEKKNCKTYRGGDNLPAGYSVTECDYTFTQRELFEAIVKYVMSNYELPKTIELPLDDGDELDFEVYTVKDKDGQTFWESDFFTLEERDELEELLDDPDGDDEVLEKRLREILFKDMTDKQLDKEEEY